MPGCNSRNGRWSGQDKLYCLVRSFTGKKGELKAKAISDHGYFTYNFGDGWRAGIRVAIVDPVQAKRLRKASQGFCGYEWMVESIINDGTIYGPTQPKPHDPSPLQPA